MLGAPAPWLEFNISSYLGIYYLTIIFYPELTESVGKSFLGGNFWVWVWSQPDLTSDVLSIFRPESLATSAEGTRIFTLSKRNKTKTALLSLFCILSFIFQPQGGMEKI